MEKNENGYPINQSRNRQSQTGSNSDGMTRGNMQNGTGNASGARGGCGNVQGGTDTRRGNGYGNMQNGTGNALGERGGCGNVQGGTDTRRGNGCRGMNGNMEGCGGNTVLDGFMPGYIYAPRQKFCMLYSTRDALSHGTLFEELYKPMEVYGRE